MTLVMGKASGIAEAESITTAMTMMEIPPRCRIYVRTCHRLLRGFLDGFTSFGDKHCLYLLAIEYP